MKRTTISFTRDGLQLIQEAAKRQGSSVSQFVREAALMRAAMAADDNPYPMRSLAAQLRAICDQGYALAEKAPKVAEEEAERKPTPNRPVAINFTPSLDGADLIWHSTGSLRSCAAHDSPADPRTDIVTSREGVGLTLGWARLNGSPGRASRPTASQAKAALRCRRTAPNLVYKKRP